MSSLSVYIRIQLFQIPLYRAWKDLFKKQPLPLRLMKFVIITVNQKRLNLDEEVCDWEINVIIFLRIYY